MKLITVFGRYDRLAITQRAKEIHQEGIVWGVALKRAYNEARVELITMARQNAARANRKRQ
jgi:hypothetical protein